MAEPTTEPGLSPLDQVRQIEAEVTRRIAAARVSAGRSVVIACSDAAKLKQQARQAGKQEGQAQYAVIVAKAEEEARAMITQAQEEAETLQRKGLARMEVAVHEAVAYVIGQAPEGENG